MRSRHLVESELLPMIEAFGEFRFSKEALPEIRAGAEARFADAAEPAIRAEVKTIAGPGGELALYWFDPEPGATGRPALFYIHGGGMIIGSAKDMQATPARLSAELRIPVASIDYRLAPETPFPGPQEDCLAGLNWLAENAAMLGLDPARIAILGESAGGGLAAATALMARDTGGAKLAGQILVYPMLDHRTGGPECRHRNAHTGEFIWNREANQFGWECLRGDYMPDDARKGWFSPSLAEDLQDLPATWIGVGSLDLFLDESLAYGRALVDAGVPVELHCYPGAIHGFDMMAHSAIARRFQRDLRAAVARALGLRTEA